MFQRFCESCVCVNALECVPLKSHTRQAFRTIRPLEPSVLEACILWRRSGLNLDRPLHICNVAKGSTRGNACETTVGLMQVDITTEIGARSWPDAISSGESGLNRLAISLKGDAAAVQAA